MSYNSYVFPLNASEADYFGLTKREYFAAMAMQGMLSRAGNTNFVGLPEGTTFGQAVAIESVAYADLLLAELERTKC